MPNNITNIVKFTGPKEDIKTLFNLMKSSESVFDFSRILPMPGELVSTDSPPYPPELLAEENIETFNRRKADWQENQYRLRIDYGAVDWYEWSVQNWGTKWDAYDISLLSEENTIQFDTAWATPLLVLKALSTRFPSICIDLKYADEDIGYNCGHITFFNGIKQVMWLPAGKGGDSQSKKFACEIKGRDCNQYLKEMEE